MNSVHESSPNGDSKISLSRKLGRKLNRVHKTPNWLSWHPGAPMAARPWPRTVAVSWPGAGRIVAGSRPYRGRGPGRVAGSRLPCRSPPLTCPCAVLRAMPRVYALPCRAPTQRPPARVACRIVALAIGKIIKYH